MAIEEDQTKRTLVLKGIGVSPGIVIGKAFIFDQFDPQITFYRLQDDALVSKEIDRLENALRESEKQLQEIKHKLQDMGGEEPSYIIDVHIMILKDKMFLNHTLDHIRDMRVNAEWALRMTVEKYKKLFDKVEDDYLRGRFSDIQYVGQLVIRNLSGGKREVIADINKGVVVIATDLSPADTAQMMIHKVLGFATDMGGRTSHTAIVAQSIEIPAVVGLEYITKVVRTNDDVIIDGATGLVIVHPDPEILNRYVEKRRHFLELHEEFLHDAILPATTRDHRQVEIGGNIEFVEEIPSAVSHGAEGIGLYRTEFIYINREQLPTEEDHFQIYRHLVESQGIAWSTIRTFDLGGDKFFSKPKVAKEMNPQMGLRAIRFCLKEIEMFKTQLRAIIRASAYGKVRVLFPMISGIEEIHQAKRIFSEAKADLLAQGISAGEDIEIGVMIEVPSAVVVADALAREVDFFSIGTNDLIQYVLAIDRINERVTYLYEPLHPAVLRMIRQTVEAGHRAGIRVAMCGEMAGEPMYTMILLGMELDELSMNPVLIPRVKRIIRETTIEESKALLKRAMEFNSAVEIREFVEKTMKERFPGEFTSS
ncbi:MAG TPA: phosphoenolpyruvate--protein phosphotransferase [Syntrophales bacterium]|nr:phosphoenolpyruvate--protein phosphotransferase [Syntrophales bacterium]HQA82263.1 phosphoenolpyruvate--protein phosphotransferase [Syntrophales bacterium]